MTPTRGHAARTRVVRAGCVAATAFAVALALQASDGRARAAGPAARAEPALPATFDEGFDDEGIFRRGWYDGSRVRIDRNNPFAGTGSIEYGWAAGGTTPVTSSGMRRLFRPSEAVTLRFAIRFSPGWKGTGRPYHPHLMHFLTTENGRFHGPAASHLTLYIEPWNGRLRLAAQDIQNRDRPHGLTQGPLRGGYNSRSYDSADPVFTDGRWHRVEATFRLNSLDLERDRAVPDGVVRGWVDGRLVVDRRDVVLRSPDFPQMKFNQFLLLPYFGPGLLPQAQTLWIDDLSVSGRIRE